MHEVIPPAPRIIGCRLLFALINFLIINKAYKQCSVPFHWLLYI